MDAPAAEVPVSVSDLQQVWKALVSAEDHVITTGEYDEHTEHPQALLAKARDIVEAAMAKYSGPPRFDEV
jgi:hypothetical protein